MTTDALETMTWELRTAREEVSVPEYRIVEETPIKAVSTVAAVRKYMRMRNDQRLGDPAIVLVVCPDGHREAVDVNDVLSSKPTREYMRVLEKL